MNSFKLPDRDARACVAGLNLSPVSAREVDWLYGVDELLDLPAEGGEADAVVWLPINPDKRDVRRLQLAGMSVAEEKLAEKVRLGQWNNPMWRDLQHARERLLALDEVAHTAVFGGRLSWRTRRRSNQTDWLGRYYGWVHKVALFDYKRTLSTWVANRTVFDMSDWFRQYTKHLNRAPSFTSDDADIATRTIDEEHLRLLRVAVAELRNARERQILRAAITVNYDFASPRKTPNFLPCYADENGMSHSTAKRALRSALKHIGSRLNAESDLKVPPVSCQHPPGVSRCGLCLRRR